MNEAQPDLATRRFVVPEEVANDLRAAGLDISGSGALDKTGDLVPIVLTVFNATASTVTLAQAPDTYRVLAARLSTWFHRNKSPYQMTAHGPRGRVDFEATQPPDADTVAEFLRKNIWGDGT